MNCPVCNNVLVCCVDERSDGGLDFVLVCPEEKTEVKRQLVKRSGTRMCSERWWGYCPYCGKSANEHMSFQEIQKAKVA